MITCEQCGSEVDDAGYCLRHGHRQRGPTASPPDRGTSSPPDETAEETSEETAPSAASESGAGSNLVAGLVSLPVFEEKNPSERVLPDTGSMSFARRCMQCGQRLNVAFGGQSPVQKGFCGKCGTPFDFTPRLTKGEIVQGQYRVEGPIAAGGLGWIYLARDLNLEIPVVLKGLIEPDNPTQVAIALAERRYLTWLSHPNIVRIYNFVTHKEADTGTQRSYIVMEYLDGFSLREITNRPRDRREPFPVEHVAAYGYEILQAMGYLHEQGLLYCDMKPDNVMLTQGRVKVIDLGGVRQMGDTQSPIVGSQGFQVDPVEIQTRGLTVQSDLYTVGRTLEQLLQKCDDRGADTAGVRSLEQLIARATDRDADRRFTSAEEMAGQLKGVLYEILSARTPASRRLPQVAEPSRLFEPTPVLLDRGLSTVPPLSRWTGDGRPALEIEPPDRSAIAAGLPVPAADPGDPAADLLAAIGTSADGQDVLDRLREAGASADIELRRCRAHLALGEIAAAEERLARARAERPDWRIDWHRGLIALRKEQADEEAVREALTCFEAVYQAIPGEIAPKLAIGLCQEHLRDFEAARSRHTAVWMRDRSQVNAAFGLVRLALREQNRSAAVRLLDQVPRTSQHHDAARIAAVRICSERLPGGARPSPDDLDEARRRLAGLVLDGGEPEGWARIRLTTALLESQIDTGGAEPEQRRRLEGMYMKLAKHARNAREKGVLVDLAWSVRPWSWL